MVNIEYIDGSGTFKIDGITLVRNFHSYVSGGKLRIVNAYDTRNELLPYTSYSEISVNGQVFTSAVQLAEVLAPILFSKQGASGSIIQGAGISTRTVLVPMDWAQDAIPQIVSHLNSIAFQVGNERILIKAIKPIGEFGTENSIEIHFWEFKPGKGNYGQNGQDVTASNLEYISYITGSQLNVIEVGDLGSEPIEIFVNGQGPYAINTSTLNIFEGTRSGQTVRYIYTGNHSEIGFESNQTDSEDWIDFSNPEIQEPSLDYTPNGGYTGTAQDLRIDIDNQDVRIGEIEGLGLFANQANQEIYIRNASGTTLSTLSVAFLNNEGTTFFYNETTEKLELRNDEGTVLSEVPAGAFVSNLAATLALSGNKLSLKDNEGNEVSFVEFEISNINGLQAEINDIKTAADNLADTVAEAQLDIIDLQGRMTNAETDIEAKLDKTAKIQAVWTGTQAEYDAISTPNATTLYFIQ